MSGKQYISVMPGDLFGKLTVIKEVEKHNGLRVVYCQCECGNCKNVLLQNLRSGITQSCGCYQLQRHKDPKPNRQSENYPYRNTRLFNIWYGLKRRCSSKTSSAYKYYGARGISLYHEWNRFLSFRNWALSNGYDDSLTIERLDVNGGYEPSNCKWIPIGEQNNNKSNSRKIEYGGELKTVSQWSKVLGIRYTTIIRRLNAGWSVEKSLETSARNAANSY